MLWLFTSLLFVLVQAQNLELSSRSTKFLEEEFNESRASKKFQVKKSLIAYAEISGFGEVEFNILAVSKKEAQNVYCRVYSRVLCLLWNFDMANYDDNETFEISADVRLYQTQNKNSINIRVIGSDVIELQSSPRYAFYFGGASSVNLLVSFTDMPSNLAPESSKIQFFTFQGLSGQLHSAEYLLMYLKQGDRLVNSTDKEVTRTATSTLGFGSVITLVNSDSDFCFQKSCVYSLRIETLNITYMEFQTALFAIQTPVAIEDGTTIIDQLRDNDTAIYEITSSAGDKSWNWRFNLIPIEGNPDVAINGDTKPDKVEDYRWRSTLEGDEDIYITGKEITSMNLSGDKFYVYMTSAQQSTFLMTVNKRSPFNHEHIQPNEPVTGEAEPDEIVNYFFRGYVRRPEKLRMFLRIRASSGNPDLYLKACSSLDTEQCSVTRADIDGAEALRNDAKAFFRYSNETNGDDSLFLDLNCIPDSEDYKNFSFTGDEANLFTSRTCLFAIAVVGRNSTTSTTSKYTLVLRGARFHEVLNLNQGQNFRIEQKKFENYFIDIDSSMFKEPNIDQSVNFKFVIISGDAEMYFSRSFPYPSPRHGYEKVVMVDNNNTQLHSTIKYASFTGKPAELKGRYYFSIRASQFLFGSVFCTTNYQDFEISRPDQNIELKFGQSIVNSLNANESSYLRYYYQLDVPEAQKGVEIVIQLTPIEGKFKFCVLNGKSQNITWNDCLWIDDDNDGNIIISQEDTSFKAKDNYTILILPDFTENSKGKEFTFSLSLSSQDSFVQLTEGLTYKMLVLKTPKVFRLTLPSNSKPTSDLAILLTTFDPVAEIRASTSKSALISSTTNAKQAKGNTATILYSLQNFDEICGEAWNTTEVCYIYIRVKPSNSTPYEYSLLAYSDDKPVFLAEDSEQSLPLPIKSEIELIHSPLNINKSLSVNVYSDAATLEVKVTVKSSDPEHNKGSSGQTYIVNDRGTNIIHIPAGILLDLLDPVVTISIINLDYKRDPAHFQDKFYDIDERLIVQVSSGVKRLNHLVPILETQGRKGTFIFYKFIKPIDTNAMIYLSVISGEADLYAKKGEAQFPDLNTYDFRSNTLKNDELMIPASKDDPENQDDNRSRFETYIIGVYSKVSTQFQIVASKNSSFLYYKAELGDVLIKEVPPTGSMVIAYNNKNNGRFVIGAYGLKGPVKVYYKASNENSTTDFFDTLPGETDSMFQTVSKYATRKVVQPLLGSTDEIQYLIKIVPTTGSDYVTVFIQEEGDSLYLKGGEVFYDSLEKKTCQSYVVYYDYDVVDESVNLKVDAGEVSLKISNPRYGGDLALLNEGITAPKEKFYQVKEIFKQITSKGGLVNVFKEYSIEVCSRDKPSNYRLTTSKPSLIMQRLLPGSRLSVNLHPKYYHKVFYYRVHPQTTKNIEVRVDLEKIGSISSKITNISEFLSAVDFFYLPEQEGETVSAPTGDVASDTAAFDKNKIPAQILEQNVISESGSTVGILSFNIQNGYFIIQAKESRGRGDSATIQFIVNNVYPISAFGKTLASLTPSGAATYEVLSPKDSELYLTLSSCSGIAKVEFYKVDTEDNKQLFETTTLKSNIDIHDFMQPDKMYTAYFRIKMPAEVVFFTITNLESDKNATVTISSEVTTAGDSLTVSDYFAHFNGHKGTSQLVDHMEFNDNYRKVSLALAPLIPAAGFDKKYKDFHKVIINYKAFGTKHEPNWNLASHCMITDRDSKVFETSYSAIADVNIDNGQLLWKESRHQINVPIDYDPLDPLTHVLIQIKMTFLGEHPDSADDDAIVIIADSYQLAKPSRLPDLHHPVFPIIGLVVLACVLLCIYRIYKNLKADPSKKEVRRVFEQGTGNTSRQIETVEDENGTQTAEVELKTTDRPKANDDTI